MLKFVVIAIAAFVMWKLFTGDQKKKQEKEGKDFNKKVKTGEMVKDPICGAYVPKDGDIRVRNGEKVECFCSFECRDKYIKRLEADSGE
ncbi:MULTISPECIES: TRASH domain-containing protein [Maridesulfovibrio]|uniref:TRASH domain-containing protein n=1 Tax=Maridesulfovibrio salexigens (strain ATCC 14822 / DSM 2638 / NCIMB 8403 / VKM B-1763) TaxID=526222 RepID=C6BUK1_MARSD|nr:TRASH domain-containing protein [Maridesulfovibrio salexigens]ACS80010.1 TRASH domain-containing protein [Maridesulfovibrio salexigens DSM 2638]